MLAYFIKFLFKFSKNYQLNNIFECNKMFTIMFIKANISGSKSKKYKEIQNGLKIVMKRLFYKLYFLHSPLLHEPMYVKPQFHYNGFCCKRYIISMPDLLLATSMD